MILHIVCEFEDFSKSLITGKIEKFYVDKYVRAFDLIDWDPRINYKIVYD